MALARLGLDVRASRRRAPLALSDARLALASALRLWARRTPLPPRARRRRGRPLQARRGLLHVAPPRLARAHADSEGRADDRAPPLVATRERRRIFLREISEGLTRGLHQAAFENVVGERFAYPSM